MFYLQKALSLFTVCCFRFSSQRPRIRQRKRLISEKSYFLYECKEVETTKGVKPGTHRTLWAVVMEKTESEAPGAAGCGKYVGSEMCPADSSWSFIH